MREIKFRGEDIEGVWRFGSLIIDDAPTIGKQYIIVENRVHYVVNPKTVGQFKGLKDKRNKDIYEGDIVKDNDGIEFVVKYHEEFNYMFLFPVNNPNDFMAFYPNIELEIIGNIHDNPELLKD